MLASFVLNNYCCLIFTLNNGLMCYASFFGLIMQYEFEFEFGFVIVVNPRCACAQRSCRVCMYVCVCVYV